MRWTDGHRLALGARGTKVYFPATFARLLRRFTPHPMLEAPLQAAPP
jgi:hypothetical protein